MAKNAPSAGLDVFFRPKSVAILGASHTPTKVGHVIFRNFLDGPFKGKIFGINPKGGEMFGQKIYPSILAVKEPVDLAVIAVPAKIVPQVLEECGKKKVKGAIIVTGGFSEVGEKDLEGEVAKILKKNNIRAVGVNCLGVFDPYSGVDTIFLPKYKLERPEKGNIAFISQSGAVGSVVMDWMAMKGYKISKFVSYGNATDVDEAKLIEYLSKDPKTKVICAYFEGVKEGRRFFEAARKVCKKKPLIVLKGGVTEAGVKATLSHTGSLAGAAEIYSAAFRQARAIEVQDIEQVFDFARVISTQPKPKGPRVQIITNGGGYGILTADWVIKTGLKLAKMDQKKIKEVAKKMPSYVVLKNPADLVGDTDTGRYKVMLNAAIADKNVDMIALIVLFQTPALTGDIASVIAEVTRKSRKPIIVISAGGRYTEVLKRSIEDSGTPTFSYPERAAEALKALYLSSK